MSKSLKNISIVATATVASRVLGLVREIFTAAVFGTGALASAFVTAFTLPNLFRRLLGEGALTAAFVPTLTEELQQSQRAGAFLLVSQVASWLLVVTVSLVVLAMLLLAQAGWLLPLLGERLAVGTLDRLVLGAQLAAILFPYMVFVCLAAAFSAACQVLGRFTEPALSPVWLNLSILAALGFGAWWAWDQPQRMHLLCAGVLVGGFLQMAVPAAVLWREGWRPGFDLRMNDRVRAIVRLMGPMVIGSAIYLVNMAISRFLGLSLNEQAATIINLATRVMELPIGIFTAAVATVVFPLIARHAAEGRWERLGEDYHKGLRLVLVLNVPAAVGLAVLSEPITRLLFQRGAFGAGDTALMTPVLAVYALGLPLLSYVTVALRGFYAVRDTATPVRAAAWSFVVNLGLSLLLMRWFSTVGLAAAGTIAVAVQAWYLQTRLQRRLPALGFGPLLSNLGKIGLAGALMGAAVWAGWRFLGGLTINERTADLLAVAGLVPLGAAFYAGLLWVLKIEGRAELELILQKIRGRAGGR
ncbi:MAG TPA: murein biosynthesis integral membrane protein MurJ [Opitutaceae bacterium]|nr:murein biosynthesis integral membrane protein MurJ [Opitutaceae bacterium]